MSSYIHDSSIPSIDRACESARKTLTDVDLAQSQEAIGGGRAVQVALVGILREVLESLIRGSRLHAPG